MRQRLAAIQQITKLSDLLTMSEGYEAFLKFAMSEFNSEGVRSLNQMNLS
jgi:hypothetical protein